MEYKNYHAKIEFDEEDNIFVGQVLGINDSLNFHGSSVSELQEAFNDSIENYLK
jgi:predicted HicB family RNase H-like nuclease